MAVFFSLAFPPTFLPALHFDHGDDDLLAADKVDPEPRSDVAVRRPFAGGRRIEGVRACVA